MRNTYLLFMDETERKVGDVRYVCLGVMGIPSLYFNELLYEFSKHIDRLYSRYKEIHSKQIEKMVIPEEYKKQIKELVNKHKKVEFKFNFISPENKDLYSRLISDISKFRYENIFFSFFIIEKEQFSLDSINLFLKNVLSSKFLLEYIGKNEVDYCIILDNLQLNRDLKTHFNILFESYYHDNNSNPQNIKTIFHLNSESFIFLQIIDILTGLTLLDYEISRTGKKNSKRQKAKYSLIKQYKRLFNIDNIRNTTKTADGFYISFWIYNKNLKKNKK